MLYILICFLYKLYKNDLKNITLLNISNTNLIMNAIKFGNKKGLEVSDKSFKNKIITTLQFYNINHEEKNYRFLDNNLINYLKINKHLVTLSSFGKKYYLFLTKINNKKYCFYINKKNNSIISVRYRFKDVYFNNTLLDGELLKDNNNQWIFSVIDIIIDRGNCTDRYPLNQRLEMLDDMIRNNFNYDANLDVAHLELKKYFEYKYINDIYENYKDKLSYRCSGMIFKNIIIYEKYLLYIFQENRTKKSITLSKDHSLNKSSDVITFSIKKTEFPDIYELYCSKDDIMYKYGIASINTLACSIFVNNLFLNTSANSTLYVKCRYNKKFNKWTPYDKDTNISDYNTIKEMETKSL
jgi:hypothetical protein